VNFLEDKNRTKELVEILVTSFDLNFILLFILLFYFLDSPDWSVFDFFIFWTARRRGFHRVPLKFEKVRVASYHHDIITNLTFCSNHIITMTTISCCCTVSRPRTFLIFSSSIFLGNEGG